MIFAALIKRGFSSAISATPLADLLGAIGKRQGIVGVKPNTPTESFERIFLGHLRYATFGKNDVAFCHPFVHESRDRKEHTSELQSRI